MSSNEGNLWSCAPFDILYTIIQLLIADFDDDFTFTTLQSFLRVCRTWNAVDHYVKRFLFQRVRTHIYAPDLLLLEKGRYRYSEERLRHVLLSEIQSTLNRSPQIGQFVTQFYLDMPHRVVRCHPSFIQEVAGVLGLFQHLRFICLQFKFSQYVSEESLSHILSHIPSSVSHLRINRFTSVKNIGRLVGPLLHHSSLRALSLHATDIQHSSLLPWEPLHLEHLDITLGKTKNIIGFNSSAVSALADMARLTSIRLTLSQETIEDVRRILSKAAVLEAVRFDLLFMASCECLFPMFKQT
jgi:hypothetical protein